MRTPYLIQRAKICSPMAKRESLLSQAIELDFMGSAEFEWGAIPKAYRQAKELSNGVGFKMLKVESIKEDDRVLRVYHALSEEDLATYVKWLEEERAGKSTVRLKEWTNFDVPTRTRSQYAKETNFWWDIVNNVFWSFDKEFMNRLPGHLQASWEYIAELDKEKGNA